MLFGVLIAVTSVIVGITGNKAMEKFLETAETATATVKSIRNYDDNHEVVVAFTAKDGVQWEVRLDMAY